ncbi:MAG: winged helix-turn-helix domain-containing protein [Streptosporangiales bacterium]
MPVPIQVAEQLRRDILAGQYHPGDRLSSEAELGAELGLSRPTINRAYQILADWGLAHVRQGAGTYVLEGLDLTEIVAEALHRHDAGREATGKCPDAHEHARYVEAAEAALTALRLAGAQFGLGPHR